MTQEQIKKYEQAAQEGSLPPEDNPLYLFSATSTPLLVQMLSREIDIYLLIRMQLSIRGVNEKGQWVGFDRARQLVEGKTKAARPKEKTK